MTAPKVFVSYSHENAAHQRWVSKLASALVEKGVDVTLDQWDLHLGEDISLFMERGLAAADRVLLICTDEYARKAEAGVGGVGYERTIVTAELVQKADTGRFIPVLRSGDSQSAIPSFLRSRFYVDFTSEDGWPEAFDRLLREIHEVPPNDKPSLGKNPFARLSSGTEARSTPSGAASIDADLMDPSVAYGRAVELARAEDLLGWRQLVKTLRPRAYASLRAWRADREGQRCSNEEEAHKAGDDAVQIAAPLMATALAGVESGRAALSDQRGLLDDLLDLPDWNPAGINTVVNLPYLLAYTYHSVHGAMAFSTRQGHLGIDLADTRRRYREGPDRYYLWDRSELMGWADPLGGSVTSGWRFVSERGQNWEWIGRAFGDARTYQDGLLAYYAALSIHELAIRVKDGQGETFAAPNQVHLSVPVCFLMAPEDARDRAFRLLASADDRSHLWTSAGATYDALTEAWKPWTARCYRWLANVYGIGFIRNLDGFTSLLGDLR